MTQKERSQKCYRNRKNNGLCPRCGAILGKEGYLCQLCREKVNKYRQETRNFYRDNGLCTECGKYKVPKSERICLECRAKFNNRRKPLTDEQKIKYEKRFRSQQNNLYQYRKEQGICTRCGKRKSIVGKSKCGVCLQKDAELHRIRYCNNPDVREERENNGLCYRCGKILDRDGKMCKKCRDECVGYLEKARMANRYWEMDNKMIGE